MASAEVSVSFTEAPQFQRLVDFVTEVEIYAEETGDHELQALVDDLRTDLCDMRR